MKNLYLFFVVTSIAATPAFSCDLNDQKTREMLIALAQVPGQATYAMKLMVECQTGIKSPAPERPRCSNVTIRNRQTGFVDNVEVCQ